MKIHGNEQTEQIHRGLAALITRRRIQQAVSELFGEAAVLFKDKINFKLPGGDGFKEHHGHGSD